MRAALLILGCLLPCALPAVAADPRPSPFGALVVTTRAVHADGQVFVQVLLNRPSDGRVMLGDSTPCFAAPPTLEAYFDGEAMTLMQRGGPPAGPAARAQTKRRRPKGRVKRHRKQRARSKRAARPTPTGPCAAVQFGLPPRPQGEETTLSEVVLRWAGRTATMHVRDLFVPRRLRMRSARAIRPGDRVEFEWTPTTDVWAGPGRRTAVFLHRTHALSLRVPRADIDVRPPYFAFEMPSAPPGAARIDLGSGSLRAYPPVVRCDGPRRCQSGAMASASPINAMILP